jgi:hypothetical protein
MFWIFLPICRSTLKLRWCEDLVLKRDSYNYYIGCFKMIIDKYGNYVRKCMWQLRGTDRGNISLTVHSRAILKIV